ncbi:WD repeat-containing protein 36-like [Anopheles albimanus]|uniref:WD_REPEATS_REGION domain-containing protein n=1 Tax=Anopheles albimanus TaxID=7167 RepID=A0A182F8Z8_ANOAL|nr:WD repeat-containing protein 36-like [Anopheles albimanus]
MRGSHLFQPNRALGYVSNHVPPNVRYIDQRRESIIVTCVGRSFHVYGSNSFRLIRAGRIHQDNITALASDGFLTYVAAGNDIYGWRSSVELRKVYRGHTAPVHLLLPFARHLISIDESSLLKVWVVTTTGLYLEIPFANDEFAISAIVHPASYKNKILLGSGQGGLQLWNLKSGKLVHKFGSFDSKVLQLVQAPAIDVIAIGLHNGRIVLLNIKYEEKVLEVHQDWGPVTGISFRTDGYSVMATGSSNGQIVFWDLEEKTIASTLNAHDDSVTGLEFLPNEPLLISSSPDNSLKMWIFDMPDGGARLLRYREGHAASPTCVRYHGASGRNILSSGEDASLRIFSTASETLNCSLGKASYNRKASKKNKKNAEDPFRMPAISYFTSETTRDKEWDSIAALHHGLVQVTTWSFDKRRMGELVLVPEQFQNKCRTEFGVTATCLCLTHCGNFVTIGYSSGHVERFNIQSGAHRATYGAPKAHQEHVRGLASDNLNQMIVSGAADGLLKFWRFKEAYATVVKTPIDTMKLGEPITLLRVHRESAMLCAALDDFSVLLVDMDTRVVVRRFEGHRGMVTDVCFSPDSRWLITAAQDCTIKVWDIPSAYLIDHFRVAQICTSLSMSPTGDFLATAHVDYRGINLWANKSLFSHVTLRGLKPDSEAPLLDLPTTVGEESESAWLKETEESGEVEGLEDELERINLDYRSPPQLSSELITMSDLAASRWQNLLNLDIIKKRNRPRQAPQKPKSAPFFLPTVAGLDIEFDLSRTDAATADDQQRQLLGSDGSRIIETKQLDHLTDFGKLLKAALVTEEYDKAAMHLMKLGPTMIDYEIRHLTPFDGGNGSLSVMGAFIRMIIGMFNARREFELAQSYLSVFLKQHGRAIVENEQLSELLPEIERAQAEGWSVLEDKLLYGLGVVSNLRNYTV